MSWFESSGATATQGSKIITITDGADTSVIRAGDELVLGNFSGVEISSKTAVDITLVKNWDNGNQTGSVLVKPLPTDHIAATKAMRESTAITASNFKANEEWGTELGTIDYKGYDNETYTARTLQQMDVDVQAVEDEVNSALVALSGLQPYNAFAQEQAVNSDKFAASGFVVDSVMSVVQE